MNLACNIVFCSRPVLSSTVDVSCILHSGQYLLYLPEFISELIIYTMMKHYTKTHTSIYNKFKCSIELRLFKIKENCTTCLQIMKCYLESPKENVLKVCIKI